MKSMFSRLRTKFEPRHESALEPHTLPHPLLSWFVLSGLLGLMVLTGVVIIPGTVLQVGPALAYTGRVDLVIDMRPGDTYDSLVRRAVAAARAATQRSFDRDILISDVSVMVVVQRNQAIVPMLSLQVTRSDWQAFPDPQKWVIYFSNARALLGFNAMPNK